MPETALGTEIDLLPTEQLAQEPVSKFLRWALTVGRYIVVFTEGLVLVVFLARFKLDSEIIDLKQEIIAKAQVLKQAQSFETRFLAVQKQLNNLNQILENLTPRAPLLSLVETTIPAPITLKDLSIRQGKLQIKGRSSDYNAITRWENLLQESPLLEEVSLDSLQRSSADEQNNLVEFGLSAKIKMPISPSPSVKPTGGKGRS